MTPAPTPHTVSPAVARAHAVADRHATQLLQEANRRGKSSACAPGCSHCCFEPMYAERQEAVHLVASLEAAGADLGALRQRTATWWTAFFAGGLDRTRQAAPTDFGPLLAYRTARLPCPVLVNQLCTAYSARPIGCRTHIALGSPRRCADESRRPRQQFLVYPAEASSSALCTLCENAPQALFQFDHLGVWLAHLLLGMTERSRAAHDVIVTQTDPDPGYAQPHPLPANP